MMSLFRKIPYVTVQPGKLFLYHSLFWFFTLILMVLTMPVARAKVVHIIAISRDTTTPSGFHYEKAACPFDTSGLGIKGMEFGYLTVPENRNRKNDRKIRLAVTIFKAGKKVKPASPVLLLEDGPGLSAPLGAMVGTHKLMPDRDLVVLDMRGTGFSKPTLCPWLNSTYGGESGLPGGYIEALDLSAKEATLMKNGALRACRNALESNDIDLTAYNLTESTSDVEELRQALGYKQWNILGTGYGSRVAQIVMRKYPNKIRSVVMLPPEPVDFSRITESTVPAFAGALDRFFTLCKRDSACAAAYPNLRQNFHQTIARLKKHPLHIPIDSTLAGADKYIMNAQDYITLVYDGLASGGFLMHLPGFIHAVNQRDMKSIQPFIQGIVRQSVLNLDPHLRFSWGTYYSDLCFNTGASKRRWRQYSSNWPDLSLVGFNNDGCRVWKTGSVYPSQPDSVKNDIPILAETGALDPTLMPDIIDSSLTAFSNVQKVTFPTGTHNPGPRTAGCMLGLMKDFFDNPSAPLDTSCVRKVPHPKFK
jgi:pimeloyl-ACP methyl ester carboxylesterase